MTLAIRRIEGSYVPPLLSPVCEQGSAGKLFSATALYELPSLSPVENSSMARLIGEPFFEPEPVTRPSVTYIHSRSDRVKARFRMLRRLLTDHDREGAAAPNFKSIDTAIAFIDRIEKAPDFNATLDDDGSAVIELENRATGFFADITFRAGGRVEFYKREPGQESEFFEGELETPEARQFLISKIGLVVD
jgi:hypothetical protein